MTKPLKQPKRRQPTAAPRVQVQYSQCYLRSTIAMQCPLCGADVSPNTEHRCGMDLSSDQSSTAWPALGQLLKGAIR